MFDPRCDWPCYSGLSGGISSLPLDRRSCPAWFFIRGCIPRQAGITQLFVLGQIVLDFVPGNAISYPGMPIGGQLLGFIKTSDMDVYVFRKILIFVKKGSTTSIAKASFHFRSGAERGGFAIDYRESFSPKSRQIRHDTPATRSAIAAMTVRDHNGWPTGFIADCTATACATMLFNISQASSFSLPWRQVVASIRLTPLNRGVVSPHAQGSSKYVAPSPGASRKICVP